MRRTKLAFIKGISLLPDIFLLKTLVKAILPLLLAAMSTGAMAEWVQVYWGETSDAYADLTTLRKKGKPSRCGIWLTSSNPK